MKVNGVGAALAAIDSAPTPNWATVSGDFHSKVTAENPIESDRRLAVTKSRRLRADAGRRGNITRHAVPNPQQTMFDSERSVPHSEKSVLNTQRRPVNTRASWMNTRAFLINTQSSLRDRQGSTINTDASVMNSHAFTMK
ncbi:hypothetical protein A1355_08710 [Methylomonas koyamae]|uniref:Uncharacterized protein n=2 Tax=Methylococcaceae TaxID=403 RepID=A0A177NH14_9GAMM|nr:hypothetical protein A1355_08710 [Methylomonas koyamae]